MPLAKLNCRLTTGDISDISPYRAGILYTFIDDDVELGRPGPDPITEREIPGSYIERVGARHLDIVIGTIE